MAELPLNATHFRSYDHLATDGRRQNKAIKMSREVVTDEDWLDESDTKRADAVLLECRIDSPEQGMDTVDNNLPGIPRRCPVGINM